MNLNLCEWNPTILPLINHKTNLFKRKVKHYDVDVYNFVGELTNCEVIKSNDSYINAGYWSTELVFEFRTTETRTVLHEIGHHIQNELGLLYSNYNLLSNRIKEEQQCEVIASLLYKKIYNNDLVKFDRYFNLKDIYNLNWYLSLNNKEFINDLIDLNN